MVSRLLTRSAISPRPRTAVRLSFVVDDGMVNLPHLANIVQWSLESLHRLGSWSGSSRSLPRSHGRANLRGRFPKGQASPETHLHTGNLRCWRWSTLHGQFGKPEGHAVQFQ